MKRRDLVLSVLFVVVVGCLSVIAWLAGNGKLSFAPWNTISPNNKTGKAQGGLLGNKTGKAASGEAKTTAAQMKPSDDILYLTQPVTRLYGKIDKVEGDTVSLTQRFSLPLPDGTSAKRDITFKIVVTPSTKIVRLATYIPYLFQNLPPKPDEVLSLKALTPDMVASIVTKEDVRLVRAGKLEATAMEISQVSNTLEGSVLTIQGNTLTLKAGRPILPAAIAGPERAAGEETYTVLVNAQTEISRKNTSFSPPVPEKLDLAALKPGVLLTVYTKEDTAFNTRVSALRIEPKSP